MDHNTCRHLLGSLSEYVDGELEASVCAEIERHLQECEKCRIVIDSLNKTITLYKTTSQQTSVPEGVRERLFHCLKLDEFLEG